MTYEETIKQYAKKLLTPDQLQTAIDNHIPLYGSGGLRQYLGSISVEAFTALYFYEVLEYGIGVLQQEMLADAQQVRDLAVSRSQGIKLSKAIPRGHTKSFTYSRILPLHAFLYEWSTHTILLGANDTAARDKLGLIINDLESNEALIEDFPKVKGKVFGATRIENIKGYAIAAYGSGSNAIRGLSNPTRPTLVIGDDLDSDEISYSEEQAAKLVDWWYRTVLPVGTPQNTTSYVLIGTVISKNTLIHHVISDPTFKTVVKSAVISFAANQELWSEWEQALLLNQPTNRNEDEFYQLHKDELLAGTQVLWETPRTDYYSLMVTKFNDKKSFFSEYQNQISDEDALLGSPSIASIPTDLENWLLLGSLDTTIKGSKSNDLAAWSEILFNPRTKIMIVWYVDAKRRNYDKTIADVSNRINSSVKRYDGIFVESNSAGEIIADEIQKKIQSNNYAVTKVYNSVAKKERIETLGLYIPRKQLLFVDSLDPQVINQVTSYPKVANDDIVDSLSLTLLELRKKRMLDVVVTN